MYQKKIYFLLSVIGACVLSAEAGTITFENKTERKTHSDGRRFDPDTLYAVFSNGDRMEVVSLEARIKRLLVKQPRISVTAPSWAKNLQVRTLFNQDRIVAAAGEVVSIDPSVDRSIKITGPYISKKLGEWYLHYT